MKTEWDYTELADAYLKRPEYAKSAIDKMIARTEVSTGDKICDVGAGVAHLTLELAARGLTVSAIEPNDAMRTAGIKRTEMLPNVSWSVGVGEDTGMVDSTFKLVTFGSSFNVCDRPVALKETARILVPHGWFACMWNWRNLDDALQERIEQIIVSNVADYNYGTRREDQTDVINSSGLFGEVEIITGTVVHKINAVDFAEGWRSHATLHRQSKEKFEKIISEITVAIQSASVDGKVEVPYTTKIWVAQLK